MEVAKSKQTVSLTALIIRLLPLATLVPVFLKVSLPDGARTVWAVCNIVLALVGLLLSLICVKSEESRSTVNILSTIISAVLVLMMLGSAALCRSAKVNDIGVCDGATMPWSYDGPAR